MNDFERFDGYCYRYMGDTEFTFQEAKDLCASLNSQLPDFRTEEQWDSLGKAYGACKFVHTHTCSAMRNRTQDFHN